MDRPDLKIGIIIQARMGSTRLPGKILKPIHDKTLLEHVLFRLKRLSHVATVIVATSTLSKDDIVESRCMDNNVNCFRGSEDNVLERYYRCALLFGLNHIVRLTADNPFTDIEELDNLITLHLEKQNDFTHSFASLPVGVGAEIFTFEALEESQRHATESHHLEHVDEYMLENPNLFKTSELTVTGPRNEPKVLLTVDTEDDYQKATYIIKHAATEYVDTEEAIRLCSLYA